VLTPGSPGNSGVGFGPTSPVVPAGQAFSGAAPSVTAPQITIGGVPVTAAFSGVTTPINVN
jgi:uncharacterized protein (TIGR03437 family)